MFKKTIHFIKYNNLTVLILLGFFLLGSSVFAQTETGQELIGDKQISYEGVDNTLLLQADLDNLDMDFKIESITEDDKFYYVTYTFINLEPINQAWQYQLREKVRKVSKKVKLDLGKYLAEQLKQEYDESIKQLKAEKSKAEVDGESEVIEVVEYSGLIGKTLEIAGAVFSGYEPVKKNKLPSPSSPSFLNTARELVDDSENGTANVFDDLSNVYDEYISDNDSDLDNIFGGADNCPEINNPEQTDTDGDGLGDACDSDSSNPASDLENPEAEVIDDENQEVEIIELPTGDQEPETESPALENQETPAEAPVFESEEAPVENTTN